MKTISLTKGKVALVDNEDFEALNQFKWYYSSHGYAVRNTPMQNGKRGLLYMHRVIMNAPHRMEIDHQDLNRLNNQRDNLRICSEAQNKMNRRKSSGAVGSKFKGVCRWRKNKYSRYVSRIYVKGKQIRKFFPFTPKGEIQAALHYNEQAIKYFGEFALLNNIQ